MIQIIEGNILDATEQYICHQTNCITTHSVGLAKAIFDRFPWADTYTNRTQPNVLGTIQILGNGIDQRFVINMFAQYYPGKSKYPNSTIDGVKVRLQSFHQCLLKIAKIEKLDSIAFPYGIGCGLAGEDWDYYYRTLKNFTNFVEKKQQTQVSIYKLT